MENPIEHLVLELDDLIVHVYLEGREARPLIKEGARPVGQALVGPYSYQKHGPHVGPGDRHLHIYKKRNEIFAINWDGSAHDQSHGYRIPNKVYEALGQLFPDLSLPSNRIIASLMLQESKLRKTADRTDFAERTEVLKLIMEFYAG